METAQISWNAAILFAYLSIGLIVATFLRKQIPFLQRLLIPNAIIAGLIILILSQKVINLINIPAGSMDTLVYHLLTGVFITLGLQQRRGINYRGVVTTTAIISISYAVLAVVGILFTLFWSAIHFRSFHPAFSMLPMLGFGYDHIIASSVGLQWETVGFMWGGQAGYALGVMGLLWAYIGGIILIIFYRKQKVVDEATGCAVLEGIIPRENKKPVGGYLTTAREGIETLALHLALIGLIYLCTFALMKQLSVWLGFMGTQGELFGGIIWQYNFVFGALLAYLARLVIDWLDLGHLFDSGLMARISGAMIDYLIVASIAAIPLFFFSRYLPEILLVSLLSGAALIAFISFASRRMHPDYPVERIAAAFGFMTGTFVTGLTLLRMADPQMETPVAKELAYAGGLSLLVSLPMIIFVTFPMTGYMLGKPVLYLLISLALFVGYSGLLILIWFLWNVFRCRHSRAKTAQL